MDRVQLRRLNGEYSREPEEMLRRAISAGLHVAQTIGSRAHGVERLLTVMRSPKRADRAVDRVLEQVLAGLMGESDPPSDTLFRRIANELTALSKES